MQHDQCLIINIRKIGMFIIMFSILQLFNNCKSISIKGFLFMIGFPAGTIGNFVIGPDLTVNYRHRNIHWDDGFRLSRVWAPLSSSFCRDVVCSCTQAFRRPPFYARSLPDHHHSQGSSGKIPHSVEERVSATGAHHHHHSQHMVG